MSGMALYGILWHFMAFFVADPKKSCFAPGSDGPWGALRSKRESPPHCLPSRPVQNHPGTADQHRDRSLGVVFVILG